MSWIPIRLASVFEQLIRRDPRYACMDVCVVCRSEIRKETDSRGYNEVRLITGPDLHTLRSSKVHGLSGMRTTRNTAVNDGEDFIIVCQPS